MTEFSSGKPIMSDRSFSRPSAPDIDRRSFLSGAAASGIGLSLGMMPTRTASAQVPGPAVMRSIPGTAERIPAIGMGTWITFNVGSSQRLRDARSEVLRNFFDLGGTVIDSSPMYGSSEDVIGYCLDRIGRRDSMFSATKVWTPLIGDGEDQMR